MSTLSHHRRFANEKSIEDLQEDAILWDIRLRSNREELMFFKQLLTSDVFEPKIPKLYENLQDFYIRLEDLKTEKIDLHEVLRNHRNDLNGMMECEDISCESFYHGQHQNFSNRLNKYFIKFQTLKMNILRFCTPVLRKNEN
jgi:hypothetical protein